jgi:hypothetical protein
MLKISIMSETGEKLKDQIEESTMGEQNYES